MWSSVTAAGTENGPAPSSRSKHSATLLGGHIYLLGGRNGNLPLKDLWRYNLAESRWEELRPSGDKPPALQEHSVVSYKDCLYVFGGELGFSAGTETPLWIYTVKTNCWRKIKAQRGCAVPRGRRGHTALVHRGQMLIYGGYQDLRGSSSELWSFHFETESWHLLSSSSGGGGSNNDGSFGPAPRHKHTAILDCDSMYIYGGMTDLQERNDCWKWDVNTCTWFSIKLKNKQTPGPLHGHAACRLPSCMLIFGGESNGTSTNELWRFHFTSETWDKLTISGTKPQPRSESIALAVSELVIHGCGIKNNHNNRQKTTTTTSTRCGQHKPRFSLAGAVNYNKVSPCEPPTRPSFLREISKLSQINLSRLSHPNKCSYSVLNGKEEHDHDGDDDDDDDVNNYNDSYDDIDDDDDNDYDDDNNDTEIIKEKDNNSYYPFQQVDNEVAADNNKNSRMVKSRSANAIGKRIRQRSCIINNKNKKNHHNQQQQTTSFCNNDYGSFNNRMTREPISVPNFRSLTLPTPILTPVEAARLVFVDPDDNSDNDDNYKNNQSTKLINLTEEEKSDFELFHEACQPTRGESYHSHLYEAATTTTIQSPKTPLSSSTTTTTTTKLPTSASVRFADLEEGEESTSDYASNDARSPGDQLAVDDDYCSLDTIINKKKSSLKNRGDNNNIRDGQFGFCNPNYFGVDTTTTNNNNNNDNSNKFVKILNNSSPDSLLDDKTGRSVSQTFAELLELQEIKPRIPPKSLKLDNSPSRRAVSASRAERQKAKLQASCQTTTTTAATTPTPAPFNVFIIGGKEKGQAAVFSRPVSLWKLQLGSHIF